MSVISEAIQSILADQDIKQALVDYIRADIKAPGDVWREVWYQKGKEGRKVVRQAEYVPMGERNPITVTMRLTANWNEGKRVGVIEGYITELDDRYWGDFYSHYMFLHESIAAEHYTEVIEAAQEAWGRFWIEFNAYLDREEAKQKAQVNT